MSELTTEYYDLTIAGRPVVAPARSHDSRGCDKPDGLIKRRYKGLLDLFRPRQKARSLPFEYVLEITSRCNLHCPMCPREIPGYLDTHKEYDMDMDTFRRILDRLRNVASFIWFTGLGEPMMNRNLIQMIKECRAAGIAAGMSTNATFLTDKQQERLLDSGLDLLIISFDGTDKETYEKIRVGADFDKVVEKSRNFAARKAARGAKNPWLILQMIEMKPTKDQAKKFRKMWNIPGVDSIRIKPEQFQFDESLTFEGQRKRKGEKPCPFLWRGTPAIRVDGTMLPCCFGGLDKSFGSLVDNTLEELWNSPQVQGLRNSHLNGKGISESFCAHCNTFEPGKIPMTASIIVPIKIQKKQVVVVETLNRWIPFLG